MATLHFHNLTLKLATLRLKINIPCHQVSSEQKGNYWRNQSAQSSECGTLTNSGRTWFRRKQCVCVYKRNSVSRNKKWREQEGPSSGRSATRATDCVLRLKRCGSCWAIQPLEWPGCQPTGCDSDRISGQTCLRYWTVYRYPAAFHDCESMTMESTAGACSSASTKTQKFQSRQRVKRSEEC